MVLRRSVSFALIIAFASVFAAAAGAGERRHAAMILDANTGNVLLDQDGDAPRHPASLTKMMTLYLTFETLQSGRLKMSDQIEISEAAAGVAPSKLDLDPGETITVSNAIRAVITKSANDIAVALAEKIGGSEANFVRLMNTRAREIGMANTHYENASGLPNDDQVTTARDMITLALHLQDDFPNYYPLFATREFSYGRKTYRNHNTMLNSFAGIDGVKTGYTRASGFNLVSSYHRGQKHLVGAVFGGASAATRNGEMRVLLTRALTKASSVKSRKPAAPLIAKLRTAPQVAQRPAQKRAKAAVVAVAAIADPRPFAPPQAAAQVASAADILEAMKSSHTNLRAPSPEAAEAPAEVATAPEAPTADDTAIEVFKVKQVALLGRKAKPQPSADETTDMDTADKSETLETPYSGEGRTDYGKFAADKSAEPRTLADKLAQSFGDANTPADAETFIPKLAIAKPASSPIAQKISLLGAADVAQESNATPEANTSAEADAAQGVGDAAAQRATSPQVLPVSHSAPPEPTEPGTSTAQPAKLAAASPEKITQAAPLKPGLQPSTLQAQASALGGTKKGRPATAHGKAGAAGRYLVQIGAYGSADEAQRALNATQTKAGPLLSGATSVTQPSTKDGHQIYRARFTGLDANRATSTCNELRRKAVDCFVMAGD